MEHNDEIINAAEMQQIEETCCDNSSVPQKQEWYRNVSLEDAKAFIKANITSAARSFIAIGYYLKHIRDNELFREEGHATIWEFAQAEYGISKSTASRYMTMNDRFSKDGNSPLVDDRYKDFEKSKLQEMLSLTDEQLEQVTPDMKVQQIRDLRRAKEVPYYEMEGQMEFELDFPEIMPDPEPVLPSEQKAFTLDVTDMIAGDPIEPAGDPKIQESVAISQQPEKTGSCLHRPQFPCTLTEEDKQVAGDGEDCTHSCCWNCVKHGKCRLECYASAQRPEAELPKEQQNPEKAAETAAEELEPEVIDAEFKEVSDDSIYTPKYFLKKEQKVLNEMLEAFKDTAPEEIPQEMFAHKKTVVAALAAMVCDLENEELKKQLEEEKPQQPELPKLRNNDQRAAFIDAYATWPIWIETKETAERYYRYVLPEAEMVVKVYYHKCFDYNAPASGRWEDRYHDAWGDQEYYLVLDGKHFRDCRVNRSELIDYLKEIQKKG